LGSQKFFPSCNEAASLYPIDGPGHKLHIGDCEMIFKAPFTCDRNVVAVDLYALHTIDCGIRNLECKSDGCIR